MRKSMLGLAVLAMLLALVMPSSFAQMVDIDHGSNIITTGSITWKIESNYLSRFMDIKITEINESCFLVETEPQQILLDIYQDSNDMLPPDFMDKYSHLQEQGKNILANARTIDRIPFGSLNGFTRGNIAKQNQGGTFSGIESNSFEICGTRDIGNSFAFGFGTTTVTIEDSMFSITIDPATAYCVYDCDIEIRIYNNDSVSHNVSVGNITIENHADMTNVDFDYIQKTTNIITVNDYIIEHEYRLLADVNPIDDSHCVLFNDTHYECDIQVVNGTHNETRDSFERLDFSEQVLSANDTLTLRMSYDVPENSYGKYNISFYIGSQYYNIDPWWNSTFQYCRNITIPSSSVGSDLNNFPSMLKLNSSRINYSNVQDLGQDLRIVGSPCGESGSTQAHEIELWNESGDSFVWFNSSLSSSTDTVYSYYYGNPNATDGQDVANVWADYAVVLHMDTNNPVDSSPNGNNATDYGDPTVESLCQIGNCIDLDTTDYMYIHSHTNLANTSNTIEIWLNSDYPFATTTRYFGQCDHSGGWNLVYLSSGKWHNNWLSNITGWSGPVEYATTHPADSWFYLSTTQDSENDTGRGSIYIDGDLKANAAGIGDMTTLFNSSCIIGNTFPPTYNYPLNSSIDEFRYSAFPRSADYMNASYLSMTDQLVTYGAEEEYIIECNTCANCNTMLANATGPAVINMTNDINSTGTCITMATNGKTLDCQGYTITSTGSVYPNSAVWVDADNLVLKNCEVVGGATNVWVDTDADNFNLTNNTLHDNLGTGLACVRYKTQHNNGFVEYNEIYNCLDHAINRDGSGAILGVAFRHNIIHDTVNGIAIDASDYYNNTIYDNTRGFDMSNGPDNANIYDNLVYDNTYGLYITQSVSGNSIYNNFFNNTNDFYVSSVSGSGNSLNITKTLATNIIGGPYKGGNFWSGYIGWDNTGDGLGNTDTPFVIFAGVLEDSLPLTNNTDASPPNITIHSPENISYTALLGVPTLAISVNITASDLITSVDTCSWSYNGGANVTYSTPTSVTVGTDGQHYIEVYCNDSAGNLGYLPRYFTLTHPTTIESIPIVGVIPLIVGVALLLFTLGSIITSGRIDLKLLILSGMMMMIGIVFIGVLYVV